MPITTSLGVPSRIERDPAQWSREFTDPEVLRAERERLGARCWTFLGFTRDLQNDGDWIRADLWGRSVFVQRFRDRLAGFENVCAHRFFPLKTEDKGNGALRCGLHGWMYNAEGEVIGAPMCEELFGKKASELKRPLKSIEIDTCGGLGLRAYAGPDGRQYATSFPRRISWVNGTTVKKHYGISITH